MPSLNQVTSFLETYAPLRLAEDWDNVGLLVGDRQSDANRIMTCLTVTGDSVAEAIERKADLIVTHHPLPFRPLKKVTTDTIPGQFLLQLIQHGISVYSPHTAFDSAAAGINQQLAQSLSLTSIQPLVPNENTDDPAIGSGRFGQLPTQATLKQVAESLKQFLNIDAVRCVGDPSTAVNRVGIACGSAGSFLAAAKRQGCDLFITGETTFHTCLEAESMGLGLILVGHFASERFACEQLASTLQSEFKDATIWPCESEQDPLVTL